MSTYEFVGAIIQSITPWPTPPTTGTAAVVRPEFLYADPHSSQEGGNDSALWPCCTIDPL